MSDPLITVVICTYRREQYLVRALTGLAGQTADPNLYEILVVDNDAGPSVKTLVAGHANDRVAPHYVPEPRLGLSAARNTGARLAKGRFVAFLDDDAIPNPDWIENAYRFLDACADEIAMVGGRVFPIWEAERPEWLSDALIPYFSMVDLGEEQQDLDCRHGIIGANMIVRRNALNEVGGFSEDLGRKGKSLLSNEEIQLKDALIKRGYRLCYVAGIDVSHHIPEDRLNKQWIKRRIYWQGRSDIRWERLGQRVSARDRLVKIWQFLRTAREIMSDLRKGGISPDQKFKRLTDGFYMLGRAVG